MVFDPFDHQARVLAESQDARSFGLLWEQGTGKTKTTIDNATYLYSKGEIDCVIVVAPNGVHRNWLDDELPTHLPEAFAAQSRRVLYDSTKHSTKWHEEQCRSALDHQGLLWVFFSYDGVMTNRVRTKRRGVEGYWMGGKKYLWELLRRRRCLYVLDESIDIKDAQANRTKAIVKSGEFSFYNRILNGTPISKGPFDVYTQFKFLQPNFWNEHGVTTFSEFRQRYGILQTIRLKGSDSFSEWQARRRGLIYEVVKGYKRLDELREIVASISSRVLKKDALDLPEKIYIKRYFEMNAEQRRVYEALEEEAMAELESGALIYAEIPIVAQLRCRQILSGYVPTDDPDGEPYEILGKTNPRLDLLMSLVPQFGGKVIIYCNFTMDVDLIMEKLGDEAVRYDGKVKDAERAINKKAYQTDPRIRFIVANQHALSRGHTLNMTTDVVYYNNSFNFMDRKQSEDRAHRAGLKHSVNYWDLFGGKVDKGILENLREKLRLSDEITGDEAQEWI